MVLKDYLYSMGIVVKPRLLLTNKKKNVKGGVTSYSRVKGDIERWQKEVAGNNSETHYFTTMLDFYALPNDFPGFKAQFKSSVEIQSQLLAKNCTYTI